MRTAALSPFGIAIDDVDIASVSNRRADRLRELIARHRVAVFRDQTGGDSALVHFLETLGKPTFTDGETAVNGAPSLNIVSNVGRATPPRSVFHSDTSYVAQPPSFTALRAVLLPETGGATLFSDQVGALDRLPRRFRSQVRHCSVLHRVTGLDGRNEETTHPLFRRHPLTDEVALYLSARERCVAIIGFDDATGARIIAALYRHSIRSRHLYRHAWRRGDVVVWDNRVTMHRADHDGVVGDRLLHRGMVAGEAPIAAVGSERPG